MFVSARKFHHILNRGGCNLNHSQRNSAAANHIRTRLARFYDTVSPVYGLWAGLFESRAARRAYEEAHFSGNESVLEVAVGGGDFYSMLAKTPGLRPLVGIDLSGPMLAKTGRHLSAGDSRRPDLCRANALSLPFGDRVFDILFNLYMLDLLLEEDLPRVLQEFDRVLRPGGRLIVLVMAEQCRLLNSIWMALYRCSPTIVGGCRPLPVAGMLVSYGWKIDMRELISQSGFRSELVVARRVADERSAAR